ncbi:MAG: IS3 family transposase [Nitrospirales bacterium]
MKRTRFSETQIVAILKQADAGLKIKDLCREHGISEATYYNWKAKYGGLEASDLKRLKEMEGELGKLKRMYADLALENRALKDLLGKKALTPSDKRAAVTTMQQTHGLSVVRSCQAVGLSRSAYYHGSTDWQMRDASVIKALNQLVDAHPRWGVWKYYVRLRALGHPWNHKRIYRIYRQLGLNQPRRTKRRLPKRPSLPVFVPEGPNEVWSADFMSDALYHGARFRTFNIMDDFNREALAIEIDTSLRAERVIRVLERLKAARELPHMIRVDNGPEFLAQALQDWGKANRVLIYHIQPGRPTQNAFIERFNRTYRNEVLNLYLFGSLAEVREITARWMNIYNEQRPHEALKGVTPCRYDKPTPENSTYELSA